MTNALVLENVNFFELTNEDSLAINGGSCSAALSITGFFHSTGYGLAAAALGINPFVAVGVAAGIGAIYLGGSLLC